MLARKKNGNISLSYFHKKTFVKNFPRKLQAPWLGCLPKSKHPLRAKVYTKYSKSNVMVLRYSLLCLIRQSCLLKILMTQVAPCLLSFLGLIIKSTLSLTPTKKIKLPSSQNCPWFISGQKVYMYIWVGRVGRKDFFSFFYRVLFCFLFFYLYKEHVEH